MLDCSYARMCVCVCECGESFGLRKFGPFLTAHHVVGSLKYYERPKEFLAIWNSVMSN